MFGGRRIALDRALVERLKRHAEAAGYSSVDELVTHVLERELSLAEAAPASGDDEEIKKRLKGLGYIS